MTLLEIGLNEFKQFKRIKHTIKLEEKNESNFPSLESLLSLTVVRPLERMGWGGSFGKQVDIRNALYE